MLLSSIDVRYEHCVMRNDLLALLIAHKAQFQNSVNNPLRANQLLISTNVYDEISTDPSSHNRSEPRSNNESGLPHSSLPEEVATSSSSPSSFWTSSSTFSASFPSQATTSSTAAAQDSRDRSYSQAVPPVASPNSQCKEEATAKFKNALKDRVLQFPVRELKRYLNIAHVDYRQATSQATLALTCVHRKCIEKSDLVQSLCAYIDNAPGT